MLEDFPDADWEQYTEYYDYINIRFWMAQYAFAKACEYADNIAQQVADLTGKGCGAKVWFHLDMLDVGLDQ
jgi:hypothetical protein